MSKRNSTDLKKRKKKKRNKRNPPDKNEGRTGCVRENPRRKVNPTWDV